MDSTQSELVERYQDTKIQKQKNEGIDKGEDENPSDDDLLDLLEQEDDNILARYRDERMEQLKKEFGKIDDATSSDHFGNISTVETEKQIMDIVTNNELVMVHFYQPEFHKCRIMNEKLAVRITSF